MRLRTAATVDTTPSRRTLFQTSRTRSGRILAFCSRFFRANSDEARSVPTETKDAAVWTNTQPASNFGAGTSTTSISPPLTCWRSCFISCFYSRWWRAGRPRPTVHSMQHTQLYDGYPLALTVARNPDSLDKLANHRATKLNCYHSAEAEALLRLESR